MLSEIKGPGKIVYCSKSKSTDTQLLDVILNEKFDEIYITDLVPKLDTTLEMLDEMNKTNIKIKLIDHHLTGEHMNKYSWATVHCELNGQKECGTSLVYKYLKEEGYNLDKYVELTEIIRKYDTWSYLDNENKVGEDLTRLMTIYPIEKIIEKFHNIISNKSIFNSNDYQCIYSLKTFYSNYIKDNIEQALIKEKDGYKFCVTFSNLPSFAYMVIETYLKKDSTLDFGINIDLLHNLISLKTLRDDINIGEISNLNHGGGQKVIGGFRFPEKFIDEIISTIRFK